MTKTAAKNRILVVDDSPNTLEIIERNLRSWGFQVWTALNAEEALELLETTRVDLVITDLRMPDVDGLKLTRHIRANYQDIEVMIITGYASIEGAVAAIKEGADEYLAKPFTDEELQSAVTRALEKLHMRRIGRAAEPPAIVLIGLIGESLAIRRVLAAVEKAAGTTATVLIYGESGTGKELFARAIHYRSVRAAAPFVPINCGGIPETLLESELFGHVKGSFTGAIESRAGFFATADSGTIFLDEVSELSPSVQVKLLRVLQDREFYMVGATRPQRVDVRIVAATNKDLAVLVTKGLFREDLYFRLNVINIAIPPLRERGDDVWMLCRHFAQKFAREQDKAEPTFTDKALKALKSYAWPGNVRELENTMQRLIVMTEGDVIDVPDLPAPMRYAAPRAAGLNRSLTEVEAEHIRHVLAETGGNKTRAALVLGIDRKTLREKLKQLAIKD